MPLESYLQPQPRGRSALIILSVFLVCAAALMAVTGYRRFEQATRYKQHSAELRKQIAVTQAALSPNDIEQKRRWTKFAAERNFPWAKVFRAVEHLNDPDIELLEFRPDTHKHAVVLRGEAKSREALLNYLNLIHDNSEFSNAFLAHEANVKQGQVEGIEFEIRATIIE